MSQTLSGIICWYILAVFILFCLPKVYILMHFTIFTCISQILSISHQSICKKNPTWNLNFCSMSHYLQCVTLLAVFWCQIWAFEKVFMWWQLDCNDSCAVSRSDSGGWRGAGSQRHLHSPELTCACGGRYVHPLRRRLSEHEPVLGGWDLLMSVCTFVN